MPVRVAFYVGGQHLFAADRARESHFARNFTAALDQKAVAGSDRIEKLRGFDLAWKQRYTEAGLNGCQRFA